MVKVLSVLILSLLILSPHAYFRLPECIQDTIQLEKHLLKMAAEFASLAYFTQGFRDMKLAWQVVPSWLMNCVPFIVQPQMIDYAFEDLEVQDSGRGVVVQGEEYVAMNLLMQQGEFRSCLEALKYYISEIEMAAGFAKEKMYQDMVNAFGRMGNMGPQLAGACGR